MPSVCDLQSQGSKPKRLNFENAMFCIKKMDVYCLQSHGQRGNLSSPNPGFHCSSEVPTAETAKRLAGQVNGHGTALLGIVEMS